MNKFFTQQHHFFLHQLTYSCRLQEFDDQVALIDDIIHVVEITMILVRDQHRASHMSVIKLIDKC